MMGVRRLEALVRNVVSQFNRKKRPTGLSIRTNILNEGMGMGLRKGRTMPT